MTVPVVTAVDAVVDPAREADLLDGYRQLNATAKPDGLLRSELLRGRDGAWRIQTTWRDMDAILAVRKAGMPHAAQELLERVGATHSHSVFTVEQSYDS